MKIILILFFFCLMISGIKVQDFLYRSKYTGNFRPCIHVVSRKESNLLNNIDCFKFKTSMGMIKPKAVWANLRKREVSGRKSTIKRESPIFYANKSEGYYSSSYDWRLMIQKIITLEGFLQQIMEKDAYLFNFKYDHLNMNEYLSNCSSNDMNINPNKMVYINEY